MGLVICILIEEVRDTERKQSRRIRKLANNTNQEHCLSGASMTSAGCEAIDVTSGSRKPPQNLVTTSA